MNNMYFNLEEQMKRYQLLKKICYQYAKRKTASVFEVRTLERWVADMEAELITYEKRNPNSK